jgi:hypothetical protein
MGVATRLKYKRIKTKQMGNLVKVQKTLKNKANEANG